MGYGRCRYVLVAGLFALVAWGIGPAGPLPEGAPATAPASRAQADCGAPTPASAAPAHDHDGLPAHTHATGQDALADLPGRRLEIALGGGAIKSFSVLDELLVGLRPDATGRALETLLARHLLSVVRREPSLGAIVVRHDGRGRWEPVLARLRAEPAVAWAEPNHLATTSEPCAHSPGFPGDGPLARHNARVLARCGFRAGGDPTQETGAGMIVAVLDTGVDGAHPDLAGAVLPGRDFLNGDDDSTDDSGHGTAMAGLIAGRVEGDWGIAGIAPGCRILPVKVCDRRGRAGVGDVAGGIVWAADRGAHVISVSLGSRRRSRMLDEAVRYAHARGAVVVAAAGNDNANQAHWPAACEGVIAVGALDADGRASAVTNLSARVDVYAPGERLIVALPRGAFGLAGGTSVAAALVSGAVARLRAAQPGLTPAQVRRWVAAGAHPVEGLADRPGLAGGGRLDLDRLLASAADGGPGLRIIDARCVPAHPRVGSPARVEVEVENAGPATPAPATPVFEGGPALSLTTGPGPLAEGERRVWTLSWVPAETGPVAWTVRLGRAQRRLEARVAAADDRTADLRPVGFEIEEPDAEAGRARVSVTVRNTGNVTLEGLRLTGSVERREIGRTAPDGPLAAGETRTLTLEGPLPEESAGGLREWRIRAECGALSRTWAWRFALGHRHDGRDVEAQWQQAGGVDIIADAPARVVPDRPYVPLLVFVPSRGTAATGPTLRLDHVTVTVKDDPAPAAPGTVVYDDTASPAGPVEPAIAVPGLVLVDEEGEIVTKPGGTPDLNLFLDEALVMNGRHAILRIPRDAFAVPAVPPAGVAKYLQVDVHWTAYAFLGDAVPVKDGTQKWTLRVLFGTTPMPTLPGESRYYDTHLHTIAEWHQSPDPESEPFAPSKAYGGPIQMVREAAYAVGLIEDPADTVNTVITTDHNNFHADPTWAEPDSHLHRPPFGPTSPASSVAADGTVKSEFHRMRELFGLAAGEEITISQETYYAGYAIPLGAHMLGYRAQQFPGTWHGGSALATTLFGEPPLLALPKVLHDMAKLAHPDNAGAFAYAAHPFSGGFGFDAHHLDQSIGITAPFRTYDFVSDASGTFVFKGLQVMNGRAPGSIPGEEIDFADANPFLHPGWTGGSGWDRTLQIGLRSWHEILAKTMAWSFVDKVGRKFVRKTYISAGSDAHGDFNYSTGRGAMLIPMPSTFSMNSGHFADTVSYVFSAGKPGATPGERALEALSDGNHVATDGPVIRFSLDAEGRFDSDSLVWHDTVSAHENENGRIGGGGSFDGSGTLLARRGESHLWFRYRYAGFPDYGSDAGAVKSIHVYRSSDGDPNPTKDRSYGGSIEKVLTPRGRLAAAGADVDHVEKLVAAEEGLPTKVSAYALGVFTGGDPDGIPLGPDERRGYTNPVWAIPYDAEAIVLAVDPVGKKIDKGKLELRLRFDLSMMPLPYAAGVKKLSAAGTSSDKSVPPLVSCSPLGLWGKNLATGADFATVTYVNDAAIPLSGEEYPAAGKYTFVIYFLEPLKDVNGNALHSIAVPFTIDKPKPPKPAKPCFVSASAETGIGVAAGWLALGLLAAFRAARRRRRRSDRAR